MLCEGWECHFVHLEAHKFETGVDWQLCTCTVKYVALCVSVQLQCHVIGWGLASMCSMFMYSVFVLFRYSKFSMKETY